MRVNDLAFSPDGRSLATCSTDATLTLWATHTGEGRVLPVPAGEGRRFAFTNDSCVAFTPDGRSLIHRSSVDGLVVWDLAENRWARTLLPGTTEGRQLGVAVDPVRGFVAASRWLAPGSAVHIWDSAAWRERVLYHTLETYSLCGLAFDPSGARLATNIGVLDATTGKRLLDAHLWGNVLKWSPTAPIVAGAGGAEIEVFRASTGELVATLPHKHKGGLRFAFAPDGAHLAAVNDESIRVWETTNWTEQSRFDWGIGSLSCVGFSPDGLLAACGGSDGRILVWDWDL
jgi:WD40 repeat protein